MLVRSSAPRLARYSVVLLLGIAGCPPPAVTPGNPGPTPSLVDPNPPYQPPDPPTQLAVYRRGSMEPIYGLTPVGEYDRLAPLVSGVPVGMADTDFTVASGVVCAAPLCSAEEKMDELGAQIADERNLSDPLDLIPAEDRFRAKKIPFRGNPSDVKAVEVDGTTKLYVTLGGDLMTPGNEVAVVSLQENGAAQFRTWIKVGVRPQQMVVHPDGLVFVCNQFSNYLSVIDPRSDKVLTEIETDFYCTDLALTPDADALYVSNKWRRSVLKYDIEIVRSALTNEIEDVAQKGAGITELPNEPITEILGVGSQPNRLVVNEAGDGVYVLNSKVGQIALIEFATDEVTGLFDAGSPSIDLAAIGGKVFVPTLMKDRGLLEDFGANNAQFYSTLVLAGRFEVNGLDAKTHIAHPGAIFDSTASYNFEDLRNGLFQLDAALNAGSAIYYTDNNSGEPNFGPDQKVLGGALPQAIVRNAAGNRIYIAMGGSDVVQELAVDPAQAFSVTQTGVEFQTAVRPFALELVESPVTTLLVSVQWGGEVLEVFDVTSQSQIDTVDLGYAQTAYPATPIERGEREFYNAKWSNNLRKTCAHCHFDELVSDGIGYSNGVTAPTAYHRVKPNHNLMTTDGYFWSGGFTNNSYRSVAYAAQTRTNCELILFAFTEGPASDPFGRIGDPGNLFTDGQDAQCRPDPAAQGELPPNLAAIETVIAAQKAVANNLIVAETGLSQDDLSRLMDIYGASELRLPPNPLAYHYRNSELAQAGMDAITQGERLFQSVGCAGCHQPANTRHPFADGKDKGAGADWTKQFLDTYTDANNGNAIADPFLATLLPDGIADAMIDSLTTTVPTADVNVHLDPIDYFIPFCFESSNCLDFSDPLEPNIGQAEEERRLERMVKFNLDEANTFRGWMPGAPRNQTAPTTKVNTPSLRGIWTQGNLMHHGYAFGLREAILAPGHPALAEGETGFAIDASAKIDGHGRTSDLTIAEVNALLQYVMTIE